MIRPESFRMNEETCVNNFYQQISEGLTDQEVLELAQKEFDRFVDELRSNEIEVLVVSDKKEANTPDALFPNNWISFHRNGSIALYPMFAENRRREVRHDLLMEWKKEGFSRVLDYTHYADQNRFLEGTGSVVLDRENRIAYCARSPRADGAILEEVCNELGYQAIVFNAFQTVEGKRELIYHTNVMMSIGENIAVVCMECIDDEEERTLVRDTLIQSGLEIIDISEEQVSSFAGNILQVKNKQGAPFFVMSASAKNAFTDEQIALLQKHGEIISSDLTTIETNGGGSARCMMAEIFRTN